MATPSRAANGLTSGTANFIYISPSPYNVLHSDTATGEEGGKREAPKTPDRLMPHLR